MKMSPGDILIPYALILSFVVWRITSLLYIESPFLWLRDRIGVEEDIELGCRTVPHNLIGALFDCFWCMAMVIAFVLAVITGILYGLHLYDTFLLWLASSAGALMIDVRYFARLR